MMNPIRQFSPLPTRMLSSMFVKLIFPGWLSFGWISFSGLSASWFAVVWFAAGGLSPGRLSAAERPPTAHAFLVAGPTFTGIIDEQGREQWSAPRAGARDGWVLSNGHVLVAWANEVIEFDLEKQSTWRYGLDPANGEIGSIERLENGNTLISELGANPRLIEVGTDGQIAVEVPLQPETENVHMQTRMARKLASGNYLAPHLLAFAVKQYTPAGEVVQVLRTDGDSFDGREAKHWPFTAIRLKSGHTVVGCTYGNRVVEFDAEGRVVWEIDNDDVGDIIRDACGVQRLPNGNTVVACYGAQKGVKMFEVNHDKAVVWTYAGPHRAHHFQILTTNGEPLPGKPMK